MLFDLVVGIVLIFLLVISSGSTVDVFEKIAHEVKIRRLLLATILVGFSTSLPELFVGVASALEGQPQVALGDIVGANLANLSWVIGGAVVVGGTIPVVGEYLKRDLWVTVGLGMAPFLMLTDGQLSRLDGLVLLFLYFVYLNNMIRQGSIPIRHSRLIRSQDMVHERKKRRKLMIHIFQLIFSLLVLGVSAWFLVSLAVKISFDFGVSTFWVGLIVIALGTTIPELVLSIMASKRKDLTLILGNVLGSVVVNSTLILGIIAVISPIIYRETLVRGVSGLFLILILALFWLFTRTKRKLDRWEGAVLIGVYLMFIGVQILIA